MPALPDFLARFPEVELDFAVTDRVVDFLVENGDVGIRTGHLQDPSLVARGAKFAALSDGADSRGLS
jgi:LysR family transcriptional regulator, regulator for bpeEF and oprC